MGWSNVRHRGFAVALGRSLLATVLLLCVTGRVPNTAQADGPTPAMVKAAKTKAADALKASSEATEAARAFKAKVAEDKARKAAAMATNTKEATSKVAKEKDDLAKTAKQDADKAAANVKAATVTKANTAQDEADKAADTAAEAEEKELDAKAALLKLMAKHAADEAKAIGANISSPKAKAPPFPGGAGAAAVAAAATSTPEANQVHVIIAAHTGPLTVAGTVNGIQQGAIVNATRMTNLLRNESKRKAVFAPNPTGLTGNQFTDFNITNTIENLPSGPNDTIFLYIACHGGTDTVSRQQFLQVPGGVPSVNVARTTYLNALKAKITNNQARQVVMVTDSCSNSFRANIPIVQPSAAAVAAVQVQTHALSRLLLHQTGVYDFGGSLPPQNSVVGSLPLSTVPNGELGVYYPDGGLFTKAFYNAALYAPVDQGWNDLFNTSTIDLVQETRNKFPVRANFLDGFVTIPVNPPERPLPPQNGQHPVAFPVR